MAPRRNSGLTGGRLTSVIFDCPVRTAALRGFGHSREAREMLRGHSEYEHVSLIEGHGICLDINKNTSENADAAATIVGIGSGAGDATVAPHHSAFAGSVASGETLIRKQIPTGESFTQVLASPLTLASPTPFYQETTLDPVYQWNSDHDGNSPILFQFEYPAGVNSRSVFLRIRFTGPIQYSKRFHGTGQYCLDLLGDGSAVFHEYGEINGANGWWSPPHLANRWCDGQPTVGRYKILIRPFVVEADSAQTYGMLAVVGHSEHDSGALGYKSTAVPRASTLGVGGTGASPILRSTGVMPYGITRTPVQVEADRDARPAFSVAKIGHYSTGYFVDAPFQSSSLLYPADTFTVYWGSLEPTGTSITQDSVTIGDGTVLTPTSTSGKSATYTMTDGKHTRTFRPKYTLNTSDPSLTPTLIKYYTGMADGYRTISFGEITLDHVDPPTLDEGDIGQQIGYGWSQIKDGTGIDVTEDVAEIQCWDHVGHLDRFSVRGLIPYQIRISDATDADESVAPTVISGGFVKLAQKRYDVPTARDGGTPVEGSGSWSMQCVGMGEMMSDMLSAVRYIPSPTDLDTDVQTTDIVRWVLEHITDRVDVPAIDLPLKAVMGDGSEFLIQPGDDLVRYALQMVHQFLNGRIIYDWNATPDGTGGATDFLGMARMILPPKPPYTFLAQFVSAPQGSGSGMSIAGTPASCPVVMVGPHSDQAVQQVVMQDCAMTLLHPEANMVVVSNDGDTRKGAHGTTGGGDDLGAFTMSVVDPASPHLFLRTPPDPDPTVPSQLAFIKPMYIFDSLIQSKKLMQYILRRTAMFAFAPQKQWTFTGRLIRVDDTTDTLQARLRPLRYGDMVKVWDREKKEFATAMIYNCSPYYTQDDMQLAFYEARTVPPQLAG